MSTATKPNHIGRKISRIRELKDMKQEALAQALGTNQQAVSIMENSETIDDEKLIAVAKALGVTVEAIKNFSEEAVFNYFNTFNETVSNSSFGNGTFNNECTFNPLDKVVELYERLVLAEKELVKAEKEKIEYLERVLKEK
ncbi:helix-turn-helix domain-containing protein [Flavobacterium tructae]|uniref:Transcriptional regulator n=1 Tax=Flavobacterium tructae TaxID=1114873 RepID=A0A1S1J7U7_9FLAO|nr:helix-turn-helix transcriptional regulator [Flavobacterium tructae]OHT45661.1 transcriptional regulator [Flavobacterium tructae]OXB18320.1 transcriptional regulator [Flavobacterium tructae]